MTKWATPHLQRPQRTEATLTRFFAPDAPVNRLDIVRGIVTAA